MGRGEQSRSSLSWRTVFLCVPRRPSPWAGTYIYHGALLSRGWHPDLWQTTSQRQSLSGELRDSACRSGAEQPMRHASID